MAAPLGVPMGAAIHAVNPALARAAVDAAETVRVRVLGTVKTAVKMVVWGAADVAEHRKSRTVFNLLEQT